MLAAADNDIFRTHIEPHRRAIVAHCYRMLGSLHDAEEATQESLLRAWQRVGELRAPAAAKSWLYRIATNTCLDRLKQRRRRVQPHLVTAGSGAEPLWIEPAPDDLFDLPDPSASAPDARIAMRETIGLAFVTALQLLPAKQRAALLLVDVLEWTPRETAELLATTEPAVNSLLQRARKKLDTPPAARPSDHEEQEALRRYIAIWESGDIDGFTSMLAHDAIISMPPQPAWFSGHAEIRSFFERARAGAKPTRHIAIRANGCPALAIYVRTADGTEYRASSITILCLRAGMISQVTRFGMPHLFPRFGLPDLVLAGAR